MSNSASSMNFQRPRLLVVDDHNHTRFMMSELLGDLGYDCDTLHDSDEAIELVLGCPSRYVAVLIDIHLGNGATQGLSAARTLDIARRDSAAIPPLLALTGDSNFFRLETVADYGIVDVVPKPINKWLLQQILSRVTL
ncbi:Response regulator receiver domain-containing protein [Poseidonocella pacifica]|uniref:Response regulator receiver domain-containing protein n=1 Tax=Poseidonocella pacifica TaxID=871651 RepID=A0A1I0V6Q5_9RHOB|nr:response regulator [Poseidonocella pacifica]SFA71922.1 Response regulator receiver domain-containing protein [Poseidonocella pacifica]